ncbi:Asp-tRNA(Asn)/Glu-tRNA(Gln) amidotransferase subunit GatA [Egibacter rhizosphaerae]|uniref:Glutamyl-tRNA(Gln) amidotransferase subunit A n=1 Tax=Egibacter rhizosphaerae TaxID=1670831 RepID=A0A411YCZ3_9ACTN|nr:Asp-tRNA(Asn)/Glu-tRNA(Gln) amidotransferase subunit GatA [Egibacter rhizosphaerae]QBI19045.1 Asp-tRNA(Asn)/Glu-tRNA(Gln) amidotransferase subunit GatA [Egibacter rhizosphaerae]
MASSDPTRLDAASLLAAYADGRQTAEAATRAHLARIDATDGALGAFLRVTGEDALAHAVDIDRRREEGRPLGPLAGVPLALKDILATRGTPTTCGSRMLEGWTPPYDATVVERLRAADAIVLGKTNMDEFAMGSSTENSAFGPTRNPWGLDLVPGGSSGGSAAAVGAFQATLGIGTDTGGSIRQPAAFCGIVGMKPTYGLVSRYGLVAFGSSLDQVGPLARTVGDAARLYEAIAGHDPRDATSIHEAPPTVADRLDRGVAGLRVGVVRSFLDGDGVDAGVRARCAEAIERFEALGAEVVDVALPHADRALPAYYLIAPSEASSNLSRFDGVRYGLRVDGPTAEEMMARTRAEGFGPEVKRRIMIGTYALSAGYYDAYYLQAQKVRTLVQRDLATAYADCDVLVSPATPSTAFGIGDKVDDPLAMYLNDVFAVPSNLAGTPALSLPVGHDADGLPVGLQIMAPHLGEPVLFQAAAALEADMGFEAAPAAVDAAVAAS